MIFASTTSNTFRHCWTLTLLSLLTLGLQSAVATVVINDHFDDGTVTGWMSQGNARTFSAHNITESGTVLASEVVATQTNTNRGIVSTTSFDPAEAGGGFSMNFSVAGIAGMPGANGYFIGAVTDDSVFFRDGSARNFGLTFFGQDGRTGSGGGFGLAYGDNNGAGAADFMIANSDAQGDVELASFADGFDATFTVDLAGWSYAIDGLNTSAGAATSFADTGTWAAAGTDFATLFGGDDSWFATASLQQAAASAHTASYDRISVETIPEPSSATFLFLAGSLAVFARARRR